MFSVDKTSERHHLTAALRSNFSGTNNKTWLVQFSTANVSSQRKGTRLFAKDANRKKKKIQEENLHWCHAEAESDGIKILIPTLRRHQY